MLTMVFSLRVAFYRNAHAALPTFAYFYVPEHAPAHVVAGRYTGTLSLFCHLVPWA